MVSVLIGPGPSSASKAQLVQRLVQDFPKAFQLVCTHGTPAYGQALPSTAPADPQPGGGVIVSTAEFQVSVCMTRASPSASNSHPHPLACTVAHLCTCNFLPLEEFITALQQLCLTELNKYTKRLICTCCQWMQVQSTVPSELLLPA